MTTYVNGNVLHSDIDAAKVRQVYSGKNGYCCCGCSGKHRYASRYLQESAKNNGYEIDEDEVNDSFVTRVCRIIRDAPVASRQDDDGYAAAVVNDRLYIAYMQ